MTDIVVVMDGGAERAAATVAALDHAGCTDVELVATDTLDPDAVCRRVDGLVIGPGSPYARMDLVLEVIRTARERGLPLVGT